MEETQDLNVRETTPLVAPRVLKAELPMSEEANRTVVGGDGRSGESWPGKTSGSLPHCWKKPVSTHSYSSIAATTIRASGKSNRSR